MKRILIVTVFFISSICPKNSIGQAPNLGSATGFALFTSVGAVTNTAITTITGNVGSNTGAVTGFDAPSTVNGNFYIQDDTTSQAALDLLSAYSQLFNTPTTISDHAPAFSTETITAGVYSVAGAGSVGGNLTLDADGSANAVFILKFSGALTVGAGSNIILANGALAGNVFWVVEGAISIAANTTMKGTFIAHEGANSLGAASNLEGRMLSTGGAVNVNADIITIPLSGGYTPMPVKLISFTGTCTNQNIVLNWSTAIETNNHYFTIERSDNAIDWKIITQVEGATNSSVLRSYIYTDQLSPKGNYYYRLKQTDLDGMFKYGSIIFIKNCGNEYFENIKIYPNPSPGKFKLLYTGVINEFEFIQIMNIKGEKIFEAKGYVKTIDLSSHTPGFYYLRCKINGTVVTKKLIIKKD